MISIITGIVLRFFSIENIHMNTNLYLMKWSNHNEVLAGD